MEEDTKKRKDIEKSAEEKKGAYSRRVVEYSRGQGRGKEMERRMERKGFCGGGCDGFVEHVSPGCQGALVWWYRGGGRTRSAAAA